MSSIRHSPSHRRKLSQQPQPMPLTSPGPNNQMPWLLGKIGHRIQVKLGEPLSMDVLEMRSQEHCIYRQSTTFHFYVHFRSIWSHASLSHPTVYNLEPTQISRWRCHTQSSTQAMKQGKEQSWCIHMYCVLYTLLYIVYSIYVYCIVAHFPRSFPA